MEVGHLVNDRKDLEFRWFDKDGDGYLDTVEVYRPDNPAPVRVSRFDPRARHVSLDREALTDEYNHKVLPAAIEEDRRLIAALKKVASDSAAEAYEAEAAKAEMPERRRYCLDIARELHFLKVRDVLLARLAASPYTGAPLDKRKYKSTEPGSAAGGYTLGDTLRYWKFAKQIEQFSDAYAAGRLDDAGRALAEMPQ